MIVLQDNKTIYSTVKVYGTIKLTAFRVEDFCESREGEFGFTFQQGVCSARNTASSMDVQRSVCFHQCVNVGFTYKIE